MNLRSQRKVMSLVLTAMATLGSVGCASRSGPQTSYHDESMDFSLVGTVAVMPFRNLTPQSTAAERVRDVFIATLQAEDFVYVLPPGEISRASSALRSGIRRSRQWKRLLRSRKGPARMPSSPPLC